MADLSELVKDYQSFYEVRQSGQDYSAAKKSFDEKWHPEKVDTVWETKRITHPDSAPPKFNTSNVKRPTYIRVPLKNDRYALLPAGAYSTSTHKYANAKSFFNNDFDPKRTTLDPNDTYPHRMSGLKPAIVDKDFSLISKGSLYFDPKNIPKVEPQPKDPVHPEQEKSKPKNETTEEKEAREQREKEIKEPPPSDPKPENKIESNEPANEKVPETSPENKVESNKSVNDKNPEENPKKMGRIEGVKKAGITNTELGVGHIMKKAGGVAADIGMGIGKAAGGAALGVAGAVGAGMMYAGEKAALGIGYGAAYGIAGIRGSFKTWVNPIGRTISAVANVAEHMVKKVPEKQVYNIAKGEMVTKGGGYKFTALGHSVLWGSAIASGVGKAFEDYKVHKMGTMDTNKYDLSPDYQPQKYSVQHPDMAGATGDLVFALNNLR